MLTAMIAETYRDREKRKEPFSPLDFIIDYWKKPEPEKKPEPNWRANLMKAELITIAMGGQDLREKAQP